MFLNDYTASEAGWRDEETSYSWFQVFIVTQERRRRISVLSARNGHGPVPPHAESGYVAAYRSWCQDNLPLEPLVSLSE